MKISILGCGIFGTALNNYFFKKGQKVYLEKIEDSEIIFVAVPSYAVMEVLLGIRKEIVDQKIIICSKGFNKNGQLMSDSLKAEFPDNEIFFLYGPTLADEFEKGDFSAMVLAGKGSSKVEIKKQIESENLYIELSDDIVGVQVGSALKNVVLIFLGIVEGADYGQNTRAFIFAKGIEEIQKIGVALGANPNTFLGLTCAGDLTLKSRNRDLGIMLGHGHKISEFDPQPGSPQEGIANLKVARMITEKLKIETPFMNALYAIIFEDLDIKEAIRRIK